VSSTRYWQDFETGRRGYTENGVFPDDPFVEEITEEQYRCCVCGKFEMDGKRCAFGASHRPLICSDDEALS
jgi:hypothetical protein